MYTFGDDTVKRKCLIHTSVSLQPQEVENDTLQTLQIDVHAAAIKYGVALSMNSSSALLNIQHSTQHAGSLESYIYCI